jgi:hypothetical protein
MPFNLKNPVEAKSKKITYCLKDELEIWKRKIAQSRDLFEKSVNALI